MYLPAHFEQPDLTIVEELVRQAPLATLVTLTAGAIEANHVPLLLDRSALNAVAASTNAVAAPTDAVSTPDGSGERWRLRGHVARANPLWRETDLAADVVAIFHGPGRYISPSWYASKAEHGKVVPTWNYVVAHLRGRMTVHDDPDWLLAFLPTLTAEHEGGRERPWQVSDAPADYIEQMAGAIVGFEIAVTRVTGKWKVGQNQPVRNRRSLRDGLRGAGDPDGLALAALVNGPE